MNRGTRGGGSNLSTVVLCASVATFLFLLFGALHTYTQRNDTDTEALVRLALREAMLKSTANTTDNSLKICMLARTNAEQVVALPTFLLSAAESGLGVDNFRVFLVVADPDYAGVSKKVTALAAAMSFFVGNEDFATVLPVPFVQAATPDYGHAQTDAALRDHFYNADSQARGQPQTCDFLIVTEADNYYARGFGSDLVAMTPGRDLVLFDWLSQHMDVCPLNTDAVWSDCRGLSRLAGPTADLIDLGAAMWRLQFLKDNQFYLADADGRWSELAFGYMVQNSTRLSTCSWHILRKTLLMQQQ